MRSEYVLWWFSLACAVFLMFAPFTPRTMWYYNGSSPVGNAYSYRDAAGWDALSLPCGVAALISLVVGAFLRPCVIVPVLTAAGAAAAFGLTAFAAGQYWIDLARGAAAIPDYRIDPAPGLPYFAVVAIVGASYALALVVIWLRQGNDEWW